MQVPWLRRRWKWVVSGLAVLLLPALVAVWMNHRRKAQLNELGGAGAVVTLAPLVSPSVQTVLEACSFGSGRWPAFFYRIDGVEFSSARRPVTAEAVRETVEAANRVGGVRAVVFRTRGEFDGGVLPPLRDLADLEHLSLEECGVTDRDLVTVAELPRLRTLNLDLDNMVTAEGVRRLASLPRLERLSLIATAFRGREVIPILRSMPALKEVRLGGHFATSPGDLEVLQEALPGVDVSLYSPGKLGPVWQPGRGP